MSGERQQARLTATSIEAVSCHVCNLLVSNRYRSEHGNACPRCGTALHRRKPDSMSRTWALLIAAAILYVPANVYPILTVISFGQDRQSVV